MNTLILIYIIIIIIINYCYLICVEVGVLVFSICMAFVDYEKSFDTNQPWAIYIEY